MKTIFLSVGRTTNFFASLFLKTIFLITHFSLFPFIINAQSTFLEGFVIKANGDTVTGFIDAKDKKIYNICSFKKNLDANATRYRPDQLIGFRIDDGKFFQSKLITVDKSEKHVFLEYLVKGKANIYYYRDSDDHYFIETEIVDLLELTSKKVMVESDYGSYELPKRHKAKLKAVLADSEATQSKIETVSLNHRSLTNLAVSYHYDVCDTEDCIVFERRETKIQWNFIAFLGYGNYQIDLGTELKANASGSPTFGARVEMRNFLPWSNRISASFDLSFQNYSTESFAIIKGETIWFTLDGVDYQYVNDDFYDDWKDELQADLNMTVMKLPISVLYSFGNGKVRPYLGVGFMNQFVISQNKDFSYKRFVDEFDKTVPTYHFGFVGNLGTKFYFNNNRALLLELNYESTANSNINKSLKLRNKVYGVKLGFQFK